MSIVQISANPPECETLQGRERHRSKCYFLKRFCLSGGRGNGEADGQFLSWGKGLRRATRWWGRKFSKVSICECEASSTDMRELAPPKSSISISLVIKSIEVEYEKHIVFERIDSCVVCV